MSDDLPGQAVQQAAAAAPDQWPGQAVAPATPAPPSAQSWGEAALNVIKPAVEPVVRAFFQGAQEDFGNAPLGMSDKDMGWFQQHGIFQQDEKVDGPLSAARSLAENVIYPAAAALDAVTRAPGAIYRGLQAAGVAAGLPRDVVSLPDAFAGSPGDFAAPHAEDASAATVAEAGAPAAESMAQRITVPLDINNGARGSRSADAATGARIGVIGPPRLPIDQGTPAEVATAAVPSPYRSMAAMRSTTPATPTSCKSCGKSGRRQGRKHQARHDRP